MSSFFETNPTSSPSSQGPSSRLILFSMTFSVTSTEADLTPESWWQPLSSSASHNSLLPVHQGCISGCICDRILEHIKHAKCERTRLRCNITPHHVLQFPRCLLLVDGSYVHVWKIVKKKVKETLQKTLEPSCDLVKDHSKQTKICKTQSNILASKAEWDLGEKKLKETLR